MRRESSSDTEEDGGVHGATHDADLCKIGFLLVNPNLTNQEAMMQDLRKRGLPHVGETPASLTGELVK